MSFVRQGDTKSYWKCFFQASRKVCWYLEFLIPKSMSLVYIWFRDWFGFRLLYLGGWSNLGRVHLHIQTSELTSLVQTPKSLLVPVLWAGERWKQSAFKHFLDFHLSFWVCGWEHQFQTHVSCQYIIDVVYHAPNIAEVDVKWWCRLWWTCFESIFLVALRYWDF